MNKHYKGRLQRGIHEKRIWKKAEAWLTGLLILVTLLAGCGGPSQGNSFTAGGTAASASPAAENKADDHFCCFMNASAASSAAP